MHPVLFWLPNPFGGGSFAVRFFGLFILDAFFIATLWVQWRYSAERNAAIAAEEGPTRTFRWVIAGMVTDRVLWLAVPGVGWGVTLLLVLVSDLLLFLWARTSVHRLLRRHGREEADFVFNLCFWLLIVGFFGARLFWIVTTPAGRDDFATRPLHALVAVWDGGIVYYGGLLCAVGYGVWYLWWKKRSILELGDVLIVGVAFTLFVGRWACFSAGCDHGLPTDMPWGLTFDKSPESLIPPQWQGTVAIHPTELYMSLNGLLIFLILAFVLRKKKFDGQTLYLFLMLYAVGRSIVEIYRGDVGRGLYPITDELTLSSSQIISIPVFVAAAVAYFRGSRRAKRARAAG